MATDIDRLARLSSSSDRAGTRASTASHHRLLRRWTIAGDSVALILAAGAAFATRSAVLPGRSFDAPAVAVASVAVLVCWFLALALAGAYDTRVLGAGPEEPRRVVLASLMVLAGVSTISYLFAIEPSRGLVLIQLPVGALLVMANRLAQRRYVHRARRHGRLMLKTLVVGDHAHVDRLSAAFADRPEQGFEVVATREPPPTVSAIRVWLDELEGIIAMHPIDALALTTHPALTRETVREIGWFLEGSRVDLLVSPDIADVGGPRTTLRYAGGTPLIHLDEPHLSGPKRLAKRLIDVLLAGALALMLSPVLLSLALLVRASSPGPALFRQVRIGMDAQPFVIMKFRTMTSENQPPPGRHGTSRTDEAPLGKRPDDPRVTRLGGWLRRWSIDELPQLWNVIRGQMSLVGPRPLQLTEVISRPGYHQRRLITRPGMTGLWQVSGRSDLTWDERMALDLRYVETWSLASDVAILARTILAVVSGRGAY